MDKSKVKNIKVYSLIDALYYCLTNVIIVPKGRLYLLYTITGKGVDFKDEYPSLAGAKAAFYNKYKSKRIDVAVRKNLGNSWRTFQVDVKWLEEKTEVLG